MHLETQASELNDILTFVKKYRKGNVFKDFTDIQIAASIVECLKQNGVIILYDNINEIIGILLADISDEYRLIHVRQLLFKPNTERKLTEILRIYLEKYDGYDIEAIRRGHYVRYKNTDRLIKKLKTLIK